MSEYRALRGRYSLLELCRTPDLATQVTLQPLRRIDVDAAILFSDLLLPLEPMGIRFDFVAGEGPAIENPIQSEADITALRRFEPREALDHVLAAIRQTQTELAGRVPLIGFAGAPFTLASYAIEGGHSNTFARTKALMYGTPAAWHRLCDVLADVVSDYLVAQIEAGVDAVQVFDSWVGALGPGDYRTFVLPHVQALIHAVTPGTPVIHFGTGTAGLLPLMRQAGGDVIGLDWRVDLDAGWAAVGHDVAVQGNLDPAVLLAKPAYIRERVKDILDRAAGRPGHIFNLGHGVHQQTPVEHVRALVEIVHELSAR